MGHHKLVIVNISNLSPLLLQYCVLGAGLGCAVLGLLCALGFVVIISICNRTPKYLLKWNHFIQHFRFTRHEYFICPRLNGQTADNLPVYRPLPIGILISGLSSYTRVYMQLLRANTPDSRYPANEGGGGGALFEYHIERRTRRLRRRLPRIWVGGQAGRQPNEGRRH